MSRIINARKISGGVAEGEALIAKTRLSFWGGTDPITGVIVEKGNELEGKCFKDKVLIFLSTKGSSGTSMMLSIAKIHNTQPAAFINVEVDALAALGCISSSFPMVAEPEEDVFALIENGDWVKVNAEKGTIEIFKKGEK